MSYLKNTLNFASYSYDASTDTPALAKMKDGTVFEVATAGKVVGTVISGCTLGADSYLLVGDKVVYKNGAYELLSPKIKNGTTINVGTGGLFATFKDANDYISQRVYTGVILNLLSTTVETSSIDVQNPCGGRLVIMGNGFTIDFSGTLNLYCIVTGNNVFWDRFDIKLNLQRTIYTGLAIKGELEYSNNCKVENINVTGDAMVVYGKLRNYTTGLLTLVAGFICGPSTQGGSSFYTNGGVTTSGGSFAGFYAGEAGSNYIGGAINTGGGQFNAGSSCSNYFAGAITTGGGQFHGGATCSNYITGAINTGGGQFHGGATCSNYIGGAITTGGGQFFGGTSCSNTIDGAITTGGGQFYAGDATNNVFKQLVALGAGSLDFGFNTINAWFLGATGTGGVSAFSGSNNSCNGQPMPAGTPAAGTNTPQFTRVN